ADLDLPGSDRQRLLLRARRSLVLGSSERVRNRPPGAGAEQRRAENKTNRRPAGRSRSPEIRRSGLGIERAYHLVSSLDRPPSARIPAFWAEAPEPLLNPHGILQYCRGLVNQNK